MVANYTKEDENFTFIEGKQIYWKNGQDSPPPDTPICGYDKSKCAGMLIILSSLTRYIILSIENIFSCQQTTVHVRCFIISYNDCHNHRIWFQSVSFLPLAIYDLSNDIICIFRHKLNKSKIEHWRINKDYIELIDKKPIQKVQKMIYEIFILMSEF